MRIVLVLVLVATLAAAACGDDDASEGSGDGRTRVVAAFFPLADAAREIGGESVEVTDLTPPGVEPHDLEVTTDLADAILDADVVLLLGGDFQPAIEAVADRRHGSTVRILDELDVSGDDPHVWLDPVIYREIVDAVADAIDAPSDAVITFKGRLDDLDQRFADTLQSCTQRTLVASHDAYGRLAARYALREETITGLVPDEEPDPSRLDELVRLIEREHVTTVFAEPLLPKRAAETLAREAHVDVATLDPLESDPGTGYVEAMEKNLTALAAGLDCEVAA